MYLDFQLVRCWSLTSGQTLMDPQLFLAPDTTAREQYMTEK